MTTPHTNLLLTTEPYAQSFIWASLQSMPGMVRTERQADSQILLQYQGDETSLSQLQEKVAQLPGLLHWQRV